MRKVACDLHMHSCLSPCGDDTMTPATAAGLSRLAGVEVAALTDHNTVRNCPAFVEACEAYGVDPLCGMELTTSEDIHLICLFRTLDEAASFEEAVWQKRVHIPNDSRFFGNQYIVSADDEIIGSEPDLLPNATQLSLGEAYRLAVEYGGVCYPAHVDRDANGIIAVLGTFPAEPPFRIAEYREPKNRVTYPEQYPNLKGLLAVYGSDSHRPEAIPEQAEFSLEVGDEGSPADAVFQLLRQQMEIT